MKATFVALAAAMLLAPTSFATAQTQNTVGTWRYKQKTNHVQANGRCGGVSYGTGARRCDTMSGGPAGGRSSGN